jgi:hypothetical protein
MHKQYARYYQPLLAGLGNYRQQGYQIALKFDYRARDKTVLDLITALAPNYVSVSAKNLHLANDSAILDNLDELTTTVASASGQSILIICCRVNGCGIRRARPSIGFVSRESAIHLDLRVVSKS